MARAVAAAGPSDTDRRAGSRPWGYAALPPAARAAKIVRREQIEFPGITRRRMHTTVCSPRLLH